MANLRISELPASTGLDGDLLVVARGNDNFGIPLESLNPSTVKANLTIVAGAGAGAATGLVSGLIIKGDGVGASPGVEVVAALGESALVLAGDGTEGAQLSWFGAGNSARIGAIAVDGTCGLTYDNDVIGLFLDGGDVGIGTGNTVPGARLHVRVGAASGVTPNGSFDDFFLDGGGGGNIGMTISADTNTGIILTSAANGGLGGAMAWDGSLLELRVGTATAAAELILTTAIDVERLRIDLDGLVGIATAPVVNVRLKVESVSGIETVARFHSDLSGFSGASIICSTDPGAPMSDGQAVGSLFFEGLNDASQSIIYAGFTSGIETAADGLEDGILFFIIEAAGTPINAMVLKPPGLGIGTLDPVTKLHILDDAFRDMLLLEQTADGGGGATIVMYSNDLTPVGIDSVGNITFRGKNNAAGDADYCGIKGLINGIGAGGETGILVFQTGDSGTGLLSNRLLIGDGVYMGSGNVDPGPGVLNVAAYEVNNNAGVDFGPAAVTSITVEKGLITAIS